MPFPTLKTPKIITPLERKSAKTNFAGDLIKSTKRTIRGNSTTSIYTASLDGRA